MGNYAFVYYQSNIDVEYEINDTYASATRVSLNASYNGIIDNPNDVDFYTFTIAKPMLMRVTTTGASNYVNGFLAYDGTAIYRVSGDLYRFTPGKYIYMVQSKEGSYSANSIYTLNLNKAADIADSTMASYFAVSEGAKIVFQTDANGKELYVNGNPIDISYRYYKNASNSTGGQVYDIELTQRSDLCAKIYQSQFKENPELQLCMPETVFYRYGTMSNMPIQNKHLLELSVFAPTSFYDIDCVCNGAYGENHLTESLYCVTLLIDPDTGKLVDIEYFNYFYDFAVGSNSMSFTRPYFMSYYYPYFNGEEPLNY